MAFSVDDRFPLSFYFRIANQLVKQAKVYREEGNLENLYLTINRYSRLMTETIPNHRGYSKHPSKEIVYHKKILQGFIKEVEKLKPVVGGCIEGSGEQLGRMCQNNKNDFRSTSQRWTQKIRIFAGFGGRKVENSGSVRTVQSFSSPSRLDNLASEIKMDAKNSFIPSDTAFPFSSPTQRNQDTTGNVVRHYFPSPVVSWIEEYPVVGEVSHILTPERRDEHLEPSCREASTPNATQDVHLAARLMEEFMALAKENTDKNLETCGVLGASLKDRTFYVTTLIVPKQESSSNSCQALVEEEIHAILDEQSLFPAGWIHTHPSQSCFLSSIDLHTQYSYQVMLPEAIAIVMAPTDPTRSYGIFRLTESGLAVLKECRETGFHHHPETDDGCPMYDSCSNIFSNPNLRFEIIDLRSPSL